MFRIFFGLSIVRKKYSKSHNTEFFDFKMQSERFTFLFRKYYASIFLSEVKIRDTSKMLLCVCWSKTIIAPKSGSKC